MCFILLYSILGCLEKHFINKIYYHCYYYYYYYIAPRPFLTPAARSHKENTLVQLLAEKVSVTY